MARATEMGLCTGANGAETSNRDRERETPTICSLIQIPSLWSLVQCGASGAAGRHTGWLDELTWAGSAGPNKLASK